MLALTTIGCQSPPAAGKIARLSTAGEIPRKRRPVMSDVARLAGVSHQTVSRVINDSRHVRAETRERVEVAMRQLDYRPNSVARALVTGRSQTLGVVSFDTTLYGPASTLYRHRARRPRGRLLHHIASLEALDRPSVLDAIERLRVQGVDGILVIAPQEGGARALMQAPAGVPLVALEAGPHDVVPVASVDQLAGARLATEHLLELGHATVWHVAGPAGWPEAEDRVAAGVPRWQAAGAAVPPPLLGDWSAALGLRARPGPARRPRGDGALRRPTTRWPSARCARCTRPAARVPATSASSASTTSRRRPTSSRRYHRASGFRRDGPHAACGCCWTRWRRRTGAPAHLEVVAELVVRASSGPPGLTISHVSAHTPGRTEGRTPCEGCVPCWSCSGWGRWRHRRMRRRRRSPRPVRER